MQDRYVIFTSDTQGLETYLGSGIEAKRVDLGNTPETIAQSMKDLGITPLIKPIRGGTDGSQLSYMGLPCPNIFAGGHNFHGRYEYVPVESIIKATQVIVGIARKVALRFKQT